MVNKNVNMFCTINNSENANQNQSDYILIRMVEIKRQGRKH